MSSTDGSEYRTRRSAAPSAEAPFMSRFGYATGAKRTPSRLASPGGGGNLRAPERPEGRLPDEVRDVRKLMTALALTTMLAVVAAASAALPHPGARYTGPTNSKVVNGFGNTVTFL